VLIIAAFSASNARMMAEPNAANQTVAPVQTSANQTAAVPTATNQTAANKTSLSQADPSYRLQLRQLATDYSKTFTVGDMTYKFVDKELNWLSARRKCLDLGGDLAVILSYAEFDQVAKILLAAMHKSVVWLGAHRIGPAADFKTNWHWVTGEPLSVKFRKWYNSYDGESKHPHKGADCEAAYMQREGDYKEGNGPSIGCVSKSYTASYLCEFPKTAEES